MEIIEELEGTRRGLYGGAVGYFSYGDSMDTCIAIRTLLLRGKTIYLQAGAGLVADSEPAREYQEKLKKGRALAGGISNAEQIFVFGFLGGAKRDAANCQPIPLNDRNKNRFSR